MASVFKRANEKTFTAKIKNNSFSSFLLSILWSWMNVDGCGWLWEIVDSCGWLWVVEDGCGWLWMVVGRCGSL